MRCTKEFTSVFTKNALWWTIPIVLFVSLLSLLVLINMIRTIISDGYLDSVRVIIILIVCFGLPLFSANTLKIRYYIISQNKMKYYSLFHPFGKTLFFENYIGKIVLTETGRDGSYKVVYLIDKNNRTAFKIMGLHYKKFGEIINAIPLRQIDFSPTRSQYFRLLVFERITIEENGTITINDRKVNTSLRYIQLLAIIGTTLFVIGSLIKMLIKLL